MIRRWTPGQWAVRVLVVLSSQAAVWLTAVEGVTPRWGLVVLVAGLAVFTALSPESSGGTVLMGVVVAWWGLALRGDLHPVSLLVAVAMLTTHVCATLAAYGPGTVPLDPALVRLWVRRGLLVLLPVPVVWLLARAVADEPAPPGLWAAGVVAALVAGVGTSILQTRLRRSP